MVQFGSSEKLLSQTLLSMTRLQLQVKCSVIVIHSFIDLDIQILIRYVSVVCRGYFIYVSNFKRALESE